MISVEGGLVMGKNRNPGYYRVPSNIHNEVFKNPFGKIEHNKFIPTVYNEKESIEIQEVKIYLNEGNYSFDMILNEDRFYMQRGNWKLETEIMDNGKVMLRYNGNHRFQFLMLEDRIILAETGKLDITKYNELVELIEVSIGYV